MKKPPHRQLTLSTETLRTLQQSDLKQVAGGLGNSEQYCTITQHNCAASTTDGTLTAG